MPIDANLGYPELGSQVFKVVFPKDEKVFAIATGYLVFASRGRYLVMLDKPFPLLHPAQRVRRVFRATLAENAGRLIITSLEVSSNPDPDRGWLWPKDDVPWDETKDGDPYSEGIDWAILKATKPDAIIPLTRRRIVGEQKYLADALVLDAKKPPENRLFSEWAERESELRQIVERLKTNAPVERRRRGGRTPYPADHYREVAMLCVALYADGLRRGFHREIATRYRTATRRRSRTGSGRRGIAAIWLPVNPARVSSPARTETLGAPVFDGRPAKSPDRLTDPASGISALGALLGMTSGPRGDRGDRTRTCDIRFWRPTLYQLSYAPTCHKCATSC